MAAQERTRPLAVSDRDTEWVRQFDRRLDPENEGAWSSGLDLARRAGSSVGPLLRRMQERSSDHRRKNLLLGAVLAAEGGGAGPFLLERARPRRRAASQLRERLAAAYLAHHLPTEAVDVEDWLPILLDRDEEVAVRVSAAFVIGRGGGRAAGVQMPRRATSTDDLGLAASMALVFDGMAASWSERWFRGAPRGAALVQRGMFLGAESADFDAVRLERVLQALESGAEGSLELRLAAALSLAGSPDPGVWIERLEEVLRPEVVAVLALDPGFSIEFARRGLLAPLAERHGASLRVRMALAMADRLDPEVIGRSRDVFRRDEVAGRVLCLGVARRLLRDDPAPGEAAWRAWFEELPELSEIEWVRIACGLEASGDRRAFEDRVLDRAYRRYRAGGAEALPRAACRATIDAALERLGAAPESLRTALCDELLWDLVLAGSNHGIALVASGGPRNERYLAGGLAPGDGSYPVLAAVDAWFRPRRSR